MAFKKNSVSKERWFTFSLAEQMGNIGSEVHRTATAKGRSERDFFLALERALELFDLTLEDPRHITHLKEIARAREFFCQAALGENIYKTSLEDLDHYFLQFAVAARLHRDISHSI